MPFSKVLHLLSPAMPESERLSHEALVVRSVRLPRLLAAVGAGGTLSVTGAVLQGLLSNPLAEPYTLGIAAGSAFGAALGFLFGLSVTPLAFVGALCSLWAVSFIARRSGGGSSASLVLAGIIANAILSAGVTFVKAVADERLSVIVLWLMGSLSGASSASAAWVWLAALVALVPAWISGPKLDAVSLGEGRGAFLGVDEKRLRFILLCTASFGTAVTVSYFGIIGFVGLVVPHLIRTMTGSRHRPLLLLSFMLGGFLLAAADGVAQRMGELPVGVITAITGGTFFCWLLLQRRPVR